MDRGSSATKSKPETLAQREQRARTEKLELELQLLKRQLAKDELSTPPREPSLDDREKQARIDKLALEKEALRYQQTPVFRKQEALKTITGAGSLVAATVALIGLLLSAFQWFQNDSSNQNLRAQERLDRALVLLGNKDEGQRLAGVISLKSFLDGAGATPQDPDDAKSSHVDQALLALTTMLAIEDSLPVRNAILAALTDINPKALPKPTLDRALKALCETSRGLMEAGGLWDDFGYSPEPLNETPIGRRAHGTAEAIVVLLQKGARTQDMSRLYLKEVDLAGIEMPGTNFDDSNLSDSDFSNALLSGSSFVGANLLSTKFEAADLRHAVFGLPREKARTRFRGGRDFVAVQMIKAGRAAEDAGSKLVHPDLRGPDFSCADLREADFSGLHVFDLTQEEFMEGNPHASSPFDFSGANLEGANFRRSTVYGIVRREILMGSHVTEYAMNFPFAGGGTGILFGDVEVYLEPIHEDSRFLVATMPKYKTSLFSMEYMLGRTNWWSAKLPQGISGYLGEECEVHKWLPMEGCTARVPWGLAASYDKDVCSPDWLENDMRGCRLMSDGRVDCRQY